MCAGGCVRGRGWLARALVSHALCAARRAGTGVRRAISPLRADTTRGTRSVPRISTRCAGNPRTALAPHGPTSLLATNRERYAARSRRRRL